MRVFIFGAGASYGCLPESSGQAPRAPLVDELFHDGYRACLHLLSPTEFKECQSAASACGSLEKWLTDRWEAVDKLKQPTSRSGELAFFGRVTFYLWDLLQQVSIAYPYGNAYRDFLARLKANDEEFSLISFNYDTLLDQAFEITFGRPLTSLEEYAAAPLIKPHGSVNWLISMRSGESGISPRDDDVNLLTATSKIYGPSPLDIQRVRVFSPSHRGILGFHNACSIFDGQYFYPALFMPLTVKLYQHIDRYFETVILRGRVYLAKASEIYLIGYRAADEVIKDMFQDVPRGTKLHVVGNATAGQVMQSVLTWAPALVEGSVHTDGFWQFAQHF